jgi:hypothetical protein
MWKYIISFLANLNLTVIWTLVITWCPSSVVFCHLLNHWDTFSFGHCVVCLSSIYGFWLPLWYLQTLAFCNKTWLNWSLFLSLWQMCPTGLSTFKNSRRCKTDTVVITIWMTITKYPYLKWQWLLLFTWMFCFLYHGKYFYRTWLYIWVIRRVSFAST